MSDKAWFAVLARCVRTDAGCLEFTGAKTPKGYGVFGTGGKLFYVHRVACFRAHGDITGLMACHSCDNPSCAEGNHLFKGTAQQNTDDMIAKGRMVRGENSPWAKVTESQVREIRASPLSLRLAGAAFGISPSHVSRIRRRVDWSHVE